jgi:alkyldihydroxyacetonephosphate synthase
MPAELASLLASELGGADRSTPAVPVDKVRIAASALPRSARAALVNIVGGTQVRDDRASRLAHAGGQGYLDLLRRRRGEADEAPDAVVLPASHGEVLAVLRSCAHEGVAVVPFGGGTSLVGGVAPDRHGFAAVIALDLSRLDRLLDVDAVSLTARAQAGMSGALLEDLLAGHGLTLGHVPDSFEFATLGGFAATRSAGRATSGVGRFEDLVRGLRVATPTGGIEVGLGGAATAGPDLRGFFLGSEGTLGVITELSLRVRPLPEERRYEAWSFPSFDDGMAALRRMTQTGTAPDVLRLTDATATRLARAGTPAAGGRLLRRYLRLRGHEQGCLLVLGWEGPIRGLEERRRQVTPLLREHAAVFVGMAVGESWDQTRFDGPYLRDALLAAGLLVETLDTGTTWSGWAELYEAVRAALHSSLTDQGTSPLVACEVSNAYHSGVGLRFTVLARRREGSGEDEDEQWLAATCAVGDVLAERRASTSHSFGVGRDHLPWMRAELGELGLEAVRAVKARLDPAGVLNPGKLIPPV